MRLQFWFDVVCPYAFLASTRIGALAEAAGVAVDWRPVLLGGVLKAHGTHPFPMDAMPRAKAVHTRWDILRTADLLAQPLSIPAGHPRRTVEAMRVLAALPAERVPEVAAVLYHAYWVDGADLARVDVLTERLAPLGLDVPALLANGATALRKNSEEAVRTGVFGVPTITGTGHLHWGVDRLRFLRRDLGLPPEPEPEPTTGGLPVEAFFDFASPFAYLGVEALPAVAAAAGSAVTFTPILLGALFRDLGTPDVPMHTFSAARRAWTVRDLDDWAAARGVPFRFPTRFPIRTVLPLRVVLVEPRALRPLFRAAWAEDRDIGRPEVVAEVLRTSGLDPSHVAAADREDVKAALRANTERARSLCVHGVPTFVVGGAEGDRYWGQDRLDHVAAALRGWRVPPPADAG